MLKGLSAPRHSRGGRRFDPDQVHHVPPNLLVNFRVLLPDVPMMFAVERSMLHRRNLGPPTFSAYRYVGQILLGDPADP